MECIIGEADAQVFKAGLKLLAIGPLVELVGSAFQLLARDVAALLRGESEPGPMRMARSGLIESASGLRERSTSASWISSRPVVRPVASSASTAPRTLDSKVSVPRVTISP